ncbi:serine hydrolase domain-containing protein [Anaeromyxobacter paludicola]|uniref:Esterase n=1 Tax=Anaeromyxobacter paludicola TaxID=2918171 RepID=A0ABM7XFG1_9BACT|nr:serine hydrolase domain-containing protein [Anaeromyxobacter paludicola]BDG10583.1 esterase [Anaeromyxobacter paludicola]
MTAPRLPEVSGALAAGQREGLAPGIAAVVVRRGEVLHAEALGQARLVPTPRPLGDGDLFDLASLTKLYTATVAARLVAAGRLELDAPASRWLPGFGGDKAAITPRHLLAHASGLPAWRPYWEALQAGANVEALLAAEPLEAPPGARAVYSDLGFLALQLVLERAGGAPLDRLVADEVAAPLGLRDTSFLPAADPAAQARRATRSFAATRLAPSRGRVLEGEVDDDNAWALGGVAGHAGLFAGAAEVAAFGEAWRAALDGDGRLLPPELARVFARRDAAPGSARALGWDTPSGPETTLGRRLGRGPRGAVGHLGWTGTSLWLDLDAGLACALLTNHCHPGGAERARIHALRRAFHDAVGAALQLG